jgi:RimJ/RimL family protein N-acetyltransferase
VLERLLVGKSVRLTALTKEDIPTFIRWYQDVEFLRLFDSRPAYPKTAEELGKWLDELQKDERTFAFAVRPVDGEEMIGYVELDGVAWQHGVCGFGVGIGDPANRGEGYGYEAGQLALAFAFDELNLHRITATVFSYNERSMALIEKLGFQREGAMREFLQRDGKRFDMFFYGLLRPEWVARNKG